MKTFFRELTPSLDSSFIVKEEKNIQFAAPFHFHDGYEFTLILKGQGKFYGGNQVMNFNEGEVYFFGPKFPHNFINEKSFIESEEIGHSISVQFQKDFLGKKIFQKPEFRKLESVLQLSHSGIKLRQPSKEIIELFTQILNQQGIKRIILMLELLDSVASLKKDQLVILSSDVDAIPNTDFSKLDVVYRYVLRNFKDNITSKEAASLACLNEAAFCRYFKRHTKKTFSQFVNQVRITHATSLLLKNEKSIVDICFECGFNNLSYFNRQFKQFTDKSPLNYRKDLLE